MTRIAASILSADFVRLHEEIKAAEAAGAHLLHLDIMDGHFVPNITIGYTAVESIRKITRLPLDVHLMIEEPDKYLQNFIDAGADYITIHLEASIHLHRSVQFIKEHGIQAGVSINPATPVQELEDIVHDLDMVLIMSVNPGFGGQSFIPHSLVKIKQLKKIVRERKLSTVIEVDGGIKLDNAQIIAQAGADILVMGSGFFSANNYVTLMSQLNEALEN